MAKRKNTLPEGVSLRSWIDRRGVLQERWDVEYYVDGKRKQETCTSEKAALDRHAEIRTDKRRGTYIDPRDGRIKFEIYAAEWMDAKNFAEGTRQAVEQRLRVHVLPTLGRLPLSSIKPTTIKKWVNSLPGDPNSKSVIFIHVNDILTCALDDGLIVKNPCQAASVQTSRPRSPFRVVKEVWTPEQINALHDALPGRYTAMVPIGAWLGLRPGEALGLSPTDIDFLRDVVHVRREVLRLTDGRRIFKLPKYDKVRDVPLFEGAKDALAAFLSEHPAQDVTLRWEHPDRGELRTVPLIVTSATGGAVDLSRFNAETWRRALEQAGIPWVSRKTGPHHLRHYFASSLLTMGYSPVEVAEYLGHADSSITMRVYAHFIQRPDEAVLRKRLEEFNGRRMKGESGEARRPLKAL